MNLEGNHLKKITVDNVMHVSDVEFCAESTGSTPEAENLCRKKKRT